MVRLQRELFDSNEIVYAVLDAAAEGDLLHRLRTDRLRFSCLFEGKQPKDVARVAPYLVALRHNSEFTEWLFEQGWDRHLGIVVLSRKPFLEVLDHLRSVSYVESQEGRRLWFRFYDPRVLRAYLPTCTPIELTWFFGLTADSVFTSDREAGYYLRFGVGDGQLIEARGALR